MFNFQLTLLPVSILPMSLVDLQTENSANTQQARQQLWKEMQLNVQV